MTWSRSALGDYHMTNVDVAPFREVLKAIYVPYDPHRGMRAISRATGVSYVTLMDIMRGRHPTLQLRTAQRLRSTLPQFCDGGGA